MRIQSILLSLLMVFVFFLFAMVKCGEPEMENNAPVIDSIVVSSKIIEPGGIINITVYARDRDRDSLEYAYDLTRGEILDPTLPETQWIAPKLEGNDTITSIVNDGKLYVSKSVGILVLSEK